MAAGALGDADDFDSVRSAKLDDRAGIMRELVEVDGDVGMGRRFTLSLARGACGR